MFEFAPLLLHAVELSGVAGRAPRVCHVGTAGGDQQWFNALFAEAVSEVRGKGAYRVVREGGPGREDGPDQAGAQAREERIEPRVLPGAS